MLKLDDLQTFVYVAEFCSFSMVAKQLDIDVGRVSRAIQRLEKEVNCNLFLRTTRKVTLTEEGRVFLLDIQAGLQKISQAQEKIYHLKNQPSGNLRVDAVSPFILHQLVPLIPKFRKLYPNITIELISNESIIDLLEEKADVAIRIGRLENSTLKSKFLGHNSLHFVASPDYIQQYGYPKNPEDLSNHVFIGFANAPHLNILPLPNVPSITPTITASNGETIRHLCLQGSGIALLSSFMVKKDIQENRLVSLFPSVIQQKHTRNAVHAVYYNETTPPKRLLIFLRFLECYLAL